MHTANIQSVTRRAPPPPRVESPSYINAHLRRLGLRDSDPKRQHFSALKRALRRLQDGSHDSAHGSMGYASVHQTCGRVSSAEWQAKLPHAYVWVDAMSMPQPALEADESRVLGCTAELEAALDSLPAYVALSWVLLVLAPVVEHDDLSDVICSVGSWRSRSWRCARGPCRMGACVRHATSTCD